MKLSKEEILYKYKANTEFINKFSSLFSIKLLLGRCIIDEKYELNPEFNDLIILTKSGQKIFDTIIKKKISVDKPQNIKLVIFLEFYHHDLFIDIEKININSIEIILDKEIKSKKIRYPWIYGRTLYDKYFKIFSNQSKILSADETTKLLKDTPQGVFQVGKYIVGPIGLLKSENLRFNSPQRNVKLYHCSDSSCTAFHKTLLKTANLFELIQNEVDKLIPKEESSEWNMVYSETIEIKNEYYDFDSLNEINLLIVNAFGKKELMLLMSNIINSSKSFREKLPKNENFVGSANSIVEKLDKAELYQLLLLEKDDVIVEYLEKMISLNEVVIPATEIREVKFLNTSGFYNISHQCNKLGFRSVSNNNLAINRLNKLILDVNSDDSTKQILEWKLRFYEFETLKEKIEAYTRVTDPAKVVKETILSGPLQITKVFEKIYGNFELPNNEESENNLINKVLWKLGFDINIYPNTINDFWNKLEDFKDTVRSVKSLNTFEKDKIRSSSVNLFVALEDILEQSLSFITWFLLSDHFLETKFKYDYETARHFMSKKLEGQVIGSNEPLRFDKNGKNTLFPLTEGFSALVQICDEIMSSSRDEYLRSKEELPSFYDKAQYTSFPFMHKILLLDLKSSNYQSIKENISEISSEFNKNSVLSIRNKLQHKRDDFPSTAEILKACYTIEEVVNKLEINSLWPNVYLFKTLNSDKYRRYNYAFEDYKGRAINLTPTSEFLGSKLIGISDPQIILPNVHIGNSLEVLRFKYNEPSEYLEYWKDYPLKKGKSVIDKIS
ncbi:hypothetical protein [Flavobacterium seoulense]|uniref:Uncharacterized protein n=1 Tax=Flavobacterium seoulense TaxID=1492738 RepID=A0A066WR61_9FLAO|nr:hypothetical protein [Flavobacterium seoulense]KDN56532.1 hypothetical protein FEM21_00350 [Flavobacterium seoulense]